MTDATRVLDSLQNVIIRSVEAGAPSSTGMEFVQSLEDSFDSSAILGLWKKKLKKS